MVANVAFSSPFLGRAWLTLSSLLALFLFLFFWYCEFFKWKLSGFRSVSIVIVIFAGNYSSFSTELIHTCPLCVIEVHTAGALEVVPVKDINYPFYSWRRLTWALVRHLHTSISLCFYLFHAHANTPTLLPSSSSAISHFIPPYNGHSIRTVPEPLQPHSVPRPPPRHSWLGPKKDPSGPASLKW